MGLTLETLPLNEYKAVCDMFQDDIYDAISLDKCVAGRTVYGGPSPDNVKQAAIKLKNRNK